FAAERADFTDGLDGADLIVRCHDRDENSVWSNGTRERVQANTTLRIGPQMRDFEPFLFREIIKGVKDCVVLDRRGDEVPAFVPEESRCAEERAVDTLRAADR